METRVTVITGARRGLGLATGEALARKGDRVILTARAAEAAKVAAASLSAEGLEVEGQALDPSDSASVAAFFGWLDDTHGRLDVLVNNAGSIFEETPASTLEVAPEVVLRTLENNSLSAYRMLQAALPRMNTRGTGRVVNVSSGMGGLGEMGPQWPAYRISKTAMNAVTRLFHLEAAEGVKVNSVCPGWVRTEMGTEAATRSIEEGIAGIVWAATLPEDGPSGGFFRDGEPIPW